MDRYDKSNILWDKERIYDEQPPNVEEWVSVKKHFSSFPDGPRPFHAQCFVKLYVCYEAKRHRLHSHQVSSRAK